MLYHNHYRDLSTPNHVTSRISQGHSLYQVWTLWDHSFLSYALTVSVKNALIDPLTLTFQPQTMSLLGYPKVILYTKFNYIPYTKFQHFGIIRFWVMLRTNRQMDWKILSMPADIVGVGNKHETPICLLIEVCWPTHSSITEGYNDQVTAAQLDL